MVLAGLRPPPLAPLAPACSNSASNITSANSYGILKAGDGGNGGRGGDGYGGSDSTITSSGTYNYSTDVKFKMKLTYATYAPKRGTKGGDGGSKGEAGKAYGCNITTDGNYFAEVTESNSYITPGTDGKVGTHGNDGWGGLNLCKYVLEQLDNSVTWISNWGLDSMEFYTNSTGSSSASKEKISARMEFRSFQNSTYEWRDPDGFYFYLKPLAYWFGKYDILDKSGEGTCKEQKNITWVEMRLCTAAPGTHTLATETGSRIAFYVTEGIGFTTIYYWEDGEQVQDFK